MSSSDSSDYEEMETETENILCVFCPEFLKNDRSFTEHCINQHGLNLGELLVKLGDVFRIIKAINYLRREKVSVERFRVMLEAAIADPRECPWNDVCYLEPVLIDDALLSVDFEELQAEHGQGDNHHAGEDHMNNVQYLKEQLSIAHERIVQMQKSARVILDGKPVLSTSADLTIDKLSINEDRGYIDSYSHFGIHEEMLQDVHRTESYRDAIALNRSLIQGKSCLDVGCGTGILSMFLARDGEAAKVLGVDFSDILYSAMDIVRENNLDKTIELKRCKLEDLRIEHVDVIVSEWMGYFLLYENMLDTVIHAREKFLKPGGILLPNKAHLYLTMTNDQDLHKRHVSYWDDVYGFKMSCMRKPALSDAIVSVCKAESICGTSDIVKSFDLNTVTVEETMSFSSRFELKADFNTTVTGIVGYFDTVFDLEHKVVLSTSPRKEATHWKQTTFLLERPRNLMKDESLSGKICVRRSLKDRRGLDVEIVLDDDRERTLRFVV